MSGGHWKQKHLKDAKYDMDTFNLLYKCMLGNRCTGQSSLTTQKRKATIIIKSSSSRPRTKKLNNA
jgi:hypothetical protein